VDDFPGGNPEENTMKARARLLGHPVHQMLIVFPLGLLATAVVFDLIALLSGNPGWWPVSYWVMAAGIVGALVAAPFGLIDWLAIPRNTRARRIGAMHGLGNGVVSLLFVGSWLLRYQAQPEVPPPTLALVLSFGGAGLALVTAWLGGELVSRLGVGVAENAGLNAPSSLSDDEVHLRPT
jgi:uncharacterized membrane protein